MSPKGILVIFCFLSAALNGFSGLCQAVSSKQTYQITYKQIFTFNQVPDTSQGTLVSNSQSSIYTYGISKPKEKRIATYNDSDGGLHQVMIAASKGDSIGKCVFKDLNTNVLISREKIMDAYFIVNDSLNQIKWNITNETKSIFTYKVNKAVGVFRGRNYSAWYTSEIALSDGPWKFSGLNGLILEIYDNTGQIKFEASNIKMIHNDSSILAPFAYKEFPSYESFKVKENELEQRDLEQAISNVPPSDGGKRISISFKRSKLEM